MRLRSPRWMKMATGIVVSALLLPAAQSLTATSAPPPSSRPTARKPHTVTLTWDASPSHVPGYNVYRKSKSERDYRKINSSPVQGLTYTDNTVESGVTYHYVVRAVDAQGRESVNSIEFTAAVP